ncbi:hypothetical protein HYC85_024268 [Camellia sinensis]|uniref:Large ribosomal subunit protein bL12 oligomerization domain-containing protein n=1 Tax=Camellia sinensis TaxID=4442 RepID=A0A7J7G7M2_CAMSI|nr:hypothetical protein HYC85_024268 [Camellia sinensis]
MRYSPIISQSLSRHCIITSQNPRFLPKNSHFSTSSTNFSINPYFARSRIQSWNDLNFARDYASSAQESKTGPLERVSTIVDEISGLALLEVADLTELLRKKLDINEMPVMAVMMPGMGVQHEGGSQGWWCGEGGGEEGREDRI